MDRPTDDTSTTDDTIDEATSESFPASDSPAWSSTHVGTPAPRILPLERHEAVRSALRTDIDRLSSVRADGAGPAGDAVRRAREDLVARGMLDAGRAILREPIDDRLSVRTLEAEQLGAKRDASCLVLGARYDREDVSGPAVLLAIMRAFAPAKTLRSVRFVAFADAPASPDRGAASGSARYADRLASSGVGVEAMLSLCRLDFAREREASIVFTSDLRSRSMVATASHVFRKTSRVTSHGFWLPPWAPGVRQSDHAKFVEHGWPAMMVSDGPPWRAWDPAMPDADRMAAALPGLLAVIARLADQPS